MAFKRVLSMWRPSVDFSKSPSLTRQEFLADADINNIVAKFLHTGVLSQPNLGRPSVDGLDSPGDFTESCDMFFNNEAQKDENDIAFNGFESGSQNDLLSVSQGTSGQTATSGNQDGSGNDGKSAGAGEGAGSQVAEEK